MGQISINRIPMGQPIGKGTVTVNEQEYSWHATKKCGCQSCGKHITIWKDKVEFATFKVPIGTLVNDKLIVEKIIAIHGKQ